MPIIELDGEGVCWRVHGDGFDLVVARTIEDTPTHADNFDATIALADNTRRYATFMTTAAIEQVMERHAHSGESAGGIYFVCSDLVILREPGFLAAAAAINDLLASGDIEWTCGQL
jgi:hypothetical protein